MDLLELANNPIPAGAVLQRLTTADGLKLRAARFPAETAAPRGTVCIFQGRAEQIEKYFHVVNALRRRGFAVAAFDWRGQGGSARLLRNSAKGHVPSFRHYERDIEAFRRQMVLPDCPAPYFALAHSMGAHVLLRAAADLTPWIARIVATAPLIDFGPTPIGRRAIRMISEIACLFGLGAAFIPGGSKRYAVVRRFENNPLTSDPRRFSVMVEIANQRPDLSTRAPTLRWMKAAARSMDVMDRDDFPERVALPVLFINAGADRVVSVTAIEKMARRLRGCGYVFVPGARHEIMMERASFLNQFWAAFDAFVPGTRIDRLLESQTIEQRDQAAESRFNVAS